MNIQSIPSASPTLPPAATAGTASGNTSPIPASPATGPAGTAIAQPGLAATPTPSGSTGQESGFDPAQTPEALQQALADFQAALKPVASGLDFSVDDDSGRVIVKIVDSETNEVIKQIPSEEMMRISKALDKLQGLLVKQEA